MLAAVVEVLIQIHQIHQEQVVDLVVVEQVQVEHHQEMQHQAQQELAAAVVVVDILVYHQGIMLVEQVDLVL